MTPDHRPRLLTGDTPTGRLHLGHWLGSLENRVALQETYDCYFILANLHAFTTRATQPEEIRQHVFEITLDYLAAGIDPKKSTLFVQSEIPAIAELTYYFSMLVPYTEVMRNPTIKEEMRDKNLGDHYPFGFLMYPIGQVADILAFRPDIVPVGEDQLPHLELARFVARKFNQLYCHVPPQTRDEDYLDAGGLFPLIQPMLGRVKRLIGTGGPTPDGRWLKMSKSLNNAIFLSDTNDMIQKKVMKMYTDPQRLKASDPGTTDNNPLWVFHDIFNTDIVWVAAAKERYRAGKIGDVMCKQKLIDVLVALIAPMRERRMHYASDLTEVRRILRDGNAKANQQAQKTLLLAKEALHQVY